MLFYFLEQENSIIRHWIKELKNIMKRTYIESHIFKAFSKMDGMISQDDAGLILSGLIFIKLYSLAAWEKLKELNGHSVNLYSHDFFINENLPFNRIYDFEGLDSELLKSLIMILDEADILVQGDILGEIYNFCKSDSNRKIYGEHYTPYNVIKLLINALDINENDMMLDPCTGTGRMLTIAKEVFPSKNITFIGQEKNPIAWTLAQMSAFLYNMDLKIGNSPQDALQEILDIPVEHVIMNPPFNQSYGESMEINSQIWDETTCRRSNLNFTWIQLALHYIKENGDAAIILPQTSLSMQRKEDVAARQMLIENKYVEGIICLPRGIFPSTRIKPCIWILSKKEKNSFYIIDIYNLAEDYSVSYRENIDENILSRLGLEKNQADYKIISIDDARKNGYNLQPDLYLNVNLETAVKKYKYEEEIYNLIAKLYKSQDKLKIIQKLDKKKKSTYLLKEVAKIKYGRTAPTAINGTIPVYKSGKLRFKQEFTDSIMYEKDSVIIGCKGTLSVQYAKGPFWASATTFYLMIDTDIVIPKYLYYLLRKINFKKFNVAAGLPALRRVDIEQIELEIPSISIQKEYIKKIEHLERISDCSRQITNAIEEIIHKNIEQL